MGPLSLGNELALFSSAQGSIATGYLLWTPSPTDFLTINAAGDKFLLN